MTTTPQPDLVSNSGGSPLVDEISFVEIIIVLLRHRRLLVRFPMVFAVAVGMWTLMQERTFRATASFVPQAAETSTSGAAALARQFGFNVGGVDRPGQSPQFYADLVRSREILRKAVESEYRPSGNEEPQLATLIEVYGVEEQRGSLMPWRRAVERLGDDVGASVGRETGVVHLTVTAKYPDLAEQIAERLLQLLNEFNLETRQSQALEEGRFVASRMSDAQAELRNAEEAMKVFLQQNRQFTNSPELTFEHDRLQRVVALRQEIFTSLVQAHEQARIDAVRDTPVITVIAGPLGSAEPEPRGIILRTVVSMLLGLVFAVVVAIIREFGRRAREGNRDHYREFNQLKQEAFEDFRHPGRLFRRRASTGGGN